MISYLSVGYSINCKRHKTMNELILKGLTALRYAAPGHDITASRRFHPLLGLKANSGENGHIRTNAPARRASASYYSHSHGTLIAV